MKICRMCIVLAFRWLLFRLGMNLSPTNKKEEIEKLCSNIPVLSEYPTVLESHVKLRYLKKISVVGIVRFKIPCEQFNTECLHQSNNLIYLAM